MARPCFTLRYHQLAVCLLAVLSLAGCASTIGAVDDAGLQCAPYARQHSGIRIYGDAWTWWASADGRYVRGRIPVAGSVMVLDGYAGPEHGHVAVVRKLVSSSEIRVDHANWLNDGAIYVNNPVRDISAARDWSLVQVWNIRTQNWGARAYPVRGFIGPEALHKEIGS